MDKKRPLYAKNVKKQTHPEQWIDSERTRGATPGLFEKKTEKISKKYLWNGFKTIAIRLDVNYNKEVVCPRDEVVSCRRARRVIIMDQPGNRAADLRRVRLCAKRAHPAACT